MHSIHRCSSGGGSIIVWGCLSADGTDNISVHTGNISVHTGNISVHTGNISVIDGRMNAAAYQNILEEKFMIFLENLELPFDRIFQHDNDPKHTAKFLKKWFHENNVNVLNGQVSPQI